MAYIYINSKVKVNRHINPIECTEYTRHFDQLLNSSLVAQSQLCTTEEDTWSGRKFWYI